MRPSTSAGVRCSRARSARFGGRPAGRPLATVRFSGSGVTSFRPGVMRKSFGSSLQLCFICVKSAQQRQDLFIIDGLITIVLGLMILAQSPASGLWVIGLFIGIDLMFYGLAWMAIAPVIL